MVLNNKCSFTPVINRVNLRNIVNAKLESAADRLAHRMVAGRPSYKPRPQSIIAFVAFASAWRENFLKRLTEESELTPNDATVAVVIMDGDHSQLACVTLTPEWAFLTPKWELELVERMAKLERAFGLGIVFAIRRKDGGLAKNCVRYFSGAAEDEAQVDRWLWDIADGRGPLGVRWLKQFTSLNKSRGPWGFDPGGAES